MNKAKFLKKSILFAILGILALSLIPAASAGVPRFMQGRPSGNNLASTMFTGINTFSASADLYFRLGWAYSIEERENDWGPANPWKYKLFINNEEINLQRYEVNVDDDPEIIKLSMWYHIFGPGYFTVGEEYLLRLEFWVKQPYQDDGLNYWRIFVNYENNDEFSFEDYLNIIA